MLGKKKEGEAGEVKSILSEGLKIEGNIISEGKIRIDGIVEGDVKGDFVVLGETSKIRGNLKVKNLISMGEVEGNILAEYVEIKKSSRIKGDITTQSLSVEPGASIEGSVKSGNFASSPSEIEE
jgi:cytoskeletal protein CcmA (bactofilin family)